MIEREVVEKSAVPASDIIEGERDVKIAEREKFSKPQCLRRNAAPVDPQRCRAIATKLLRVILRYLPIGIIKFSRRGTCHSERRPIFAVVFFACSWALASLSSSVPSERQSWFAWQPEQPFWGALGSIR